MAADGNRRIIRGARPTPITVAERARLRALAPPAKPTLRERFATTAWAAVIAALPLLVLYWPEVFAWSREALPWL